MFDAQKATVVNDEGCMHTLALKSINVSYNVTQSSRKYSSKINVYLKHLFANVILM